MQKASTALFVFTAHIPGPDAPCFLVKMQGTCLYWNDTERRWVRFGRATQFTESAAYACLGSIRPWVCDVVCGR